MCGMEIKLFLKKVTYQGKAENLDPYQKKAKILIRGKLNYLRILFVRVPAGNYYVSGSSATDLLKKF